MQQLVRVSLNEIDATVKKAVRGAGYSWGLADDAGKAVRWMETNNLPGVATFAWFLERVLSGDICRDVYADEIQFALKGSGPVCPVSAGAYFNDVATNLQTRDVFSIDEVANPLILLGFVGRTAVELSASFLVNWHGGQAQVTPTGILETDINQFASDQLSNFRISLKQPTHDDRILGLITDGSEVDGHCWATLQTMVAKTYVQNSETSRVKGAGAGLLDSD